MSVEFGDVARDLGKRLMNPTLNFPPSITLGEVKCYVSVMFGGGSADRLSLDEGRQAKLPVAAALLAARRLNSAALLV
ncbi:hypothetical protein [Mobiluncus mulieris]|uniref:hypothetical protein n=1 Tax=Mobiluncus mulieris TaxID=2052 RepID=UPI002093C545|nr:hypothetical protein [Mobiluncus mulieris]